jgi:hypothetical protein
MNPEIFAEWLQRQGHRVVQTSSSFWFDQGPKVFQAFPYHWIIEPSEKEIFTLLKNNNAIGLRYSSSINAPLGKLSYHVVNNSSPFELEIMPRKVRHDINKGLDYSVIEKIPISRLIVEGWRLRLETLLRQGREKAENESWWKNLCYSAQDLPGFDAWGVLRDGQLVSSLLAFTFNDCYTFLYHQSLSDHLQYGINNALFYVATSNALKQKGINQVFLALQSLDATQDVDNFKFRMGYLAKPIRQRVVFHPLIQPLINNNSYKLLAYGQKLFSKNNLLAKAVGLVNFYLQGKLPLANQTWPGQLILHKEKINKLIGK